MFGVSRVLLRGGVVATIAVVAVPQTSQAQQQLATYVCQTPRFWCAFQWAAGYRNGTGCYCMTYMGPVSGYSINPAGVPDAPRLPKPQTPTQGGGDPIPPSDARIPGDDCYNGLGNCPGSFGAAAGSSGGSSGTASGPTRGDEDALATTIERIIAAAPRFETITGARLRSSGSSTRYTGTIQLPGFKGCSVVEKDDGDRRYECDAPNTRFQAMVERFASLYGSQFHDQGNERDLRFRSWKVGDIEVTVWDDDDGGSYVDFQPID
jgi:hypothetical protein